MATLKYIGPRLSTGEPERSLNYDGMPAGDLDDESLTPEQVKLALKSGLYERAAPPPPKKPKDPKRPKAAEQPVTPVTLIDGDLSVTSTATINGDPVQGVVETTQDPPDGEEPGADTED